MTTTPDILRHAVLRTGPHQANSEPREPREALCGRMATRYVSSRALGVTCEACRHEMDVVRSAAIADGELGGEEPVPGVTVLHTTTDPDTTIRGSHRRPTASTRLRGSAGQRGGAALVPPRWAASARSASRAVVRSSLILTPRSCATSARTTCRPVPSALAEEHTAWNRYQAAIIAGDRSPHSRRLARLGGIRWVVLDAINGSAQLPARRAQIAMYNRACRRADCDVRWNRHGVSARCERAAVIAGRIAVAGGAAAARCWDGDCQTT